MFLAHDQQLATTIHDEASDADEMRWRGRQAVGCDWEPLGQHEVRFVAVVVLEAELNRNGHQTGALCRDLESKMNLKQNKKEDGK
jgi:hypothetical protein